MTDIRAAGGGSSQILLMDVRTGKHIHATRTLDSTGFESISFFRGGRRIVTSSVRDADHRGPLTVRFWDAEGLLPIGDPVPLAPDVHLLQVSPDQSHAVNLEV